jgi:cobalt-zinc-cadmium resistance protein CzcA
LEQATGRAKEVYPSLKAADAGVERQQALKSTSWDMGTTSVSTGKEEVGPDAAGIFNKVGIVQSDIDIFGIAPKNKLADKRKELATSNRYLTEKVLDRDVSIAWYNALYARRQKELYSQLDSIYSGFLKAAELRYKTEETSKLEFLSASAKYKEIKVNIKRAESIYIAALQVLNQYLMDSASFDVAVVDEVAEPGLMNFNADSLNENPILDFYSKQTEIAKYTWKTEKANFLPKIDLGYTFQNVDGQSGFYAWQAGVSVPLLFFAQNGRTKAARLDYEIAGWNYERKRLEFMSQFNQQYGRYEALREVLDYYKTEALPLAEEQMEAAAIAYRLGSVDYVQFIQNVESAIKIKQEYLDREMEFNELSARLKYLAGK